MELLHNNSNVKFTYVSEKKPQFSSMVYVELRNQKTGISEFFDKHTYLQFFTILS